MSDDINQNTGEKGESGSKGDDSGSRSNSTVRKIVINISIENLRRKLQKGAAELIANFKPRKKGESQLVYDQSCPFQFCQDVKNGIQRAVWVDEDYRKKFTINKDGGYLLNLDYKENMQLGEGTCGKVFKGHDVKTKHDFAVKVIPRGKFREEEILNILQVKHVDGLVVANAAVCDGKEVKIFLKLVTESKPLDQATKFFKLCYRDIIHIARNTFELASRCHKSFIAHDDLQRGNVLVDKSSNVQLIDFGDCIFYGDESTFTECKGHAKDVRAICGGIKDGLKECVTEDNVSYEFDLEDFVTCTLERLAGPPGAKEMADSIPSSYGPVVQEWDETGEP